MGSLDEQEMANVASSQPTPRSEHGCEDGPLDAADALLPVTEEVPECDIGDIGVSHAAVSQFESLGSSAQEQPASDWVEGATEGGGDTSVAGAAKRTVELQREAAEVVAAGIDRLVQELVKSREAITMSPPSGSNPSSPSVINRCKSTDSGTSIGGEVALTTTPTKSGVLGSINKHGLGAPSRCESIEELHRKSPL